MNQVVSTENGPEYDRMERRPLHRITWESQLLPVTQEAVCPKFVTAQVDRMIKYFRIPSRATEATNKRSPLSRDVVRD